METRIELKSRAIALRQQGSSYGEIRNVLNVSKSTLSYWLKGIPLSIHDRQRLYTKQVTILARGAPSQHKRRQREIKEIERRAAADINLPLTEETFRLMGAALYWAEGSKTEQFSFCNSDPGLVVFMVRWFEKIFNTPPENLVAYLNIHAQQDDTSIKRFWSDLTRIPIKNFGKSFVKPTGTGYKKNNLYYGTIRVRVRKGTDLRLRVYGWIQAVLGKEFPTVRGIQHKWQSLIDTPRPSNLDKGHN